MSEVAAGVGVDEAGLHAEFGQQPRQEDASGPVAGVYGDLQYLSNHQHTPVILERIKRGFGIGLSHNAEARLSTRNGKTTVEEIRRVNSIDLVTNPATNTNLYEQVKPTMTTTVRALIQTYRSLLPKRIVRLLEEDRATPRP